MRLKLLLPTRVLIDQEVVKVGAESPAGAFVVLPRHIDFVAVLVPGLVSFRAPGRQDDEYLAVDEGVFVKCAEQVWISAGNAIYGPELGRMRATVEAEFRNLDQQERRARNALARLESDFVRRYLELEERIWRSS